MSVTLWPVTIATVSAELTSDPVRRGCGRRSRALKWHLVGVHRDQREPGVVRLADRATERVLVDVAYLEVLVVATVPTGLDTIPQTLSLDDAGAASYAAPSVRAGVLFARTRRDGLLHAGVEHPARGARGRPGPRRVRAAARRSADREDAAGERAREVDPEVREVAEHESRARTSAPGSSTAPLIGLDQRPASMM